MRNDVLKMEWPVAWSAVWVGALAALAVALIFGLVGIAVGAHRIGERLTRFSDVTFWTLLFSVFGAFLSFVAGGWITGKLAGFRDAESAITQAGITWLVAVPMLLILAGLGAGAYFGGWYSGLAGTPVWVTSSQTVDPNAAIVARNSALTAVTALLIGLAGSVIGGWMASGQPMRLWERRAESDKIRRASA